MKVLVGSPEAAAAVASRTLARRPEALQNLPEDQRAGGKGRPNQSPQYMPFHSPPRHFFPPFKGPERLYAGHSSRSTRHPHQQYGTPQPHNEDYRPGDYHSSSQHFIAQHPLRIHKEALETADDESLNEKSDQQDLSEEDQENPVSAVRSRVKRIEGENQTSECVLTEDDDSEMLHLVKKKRKRPKRKLIQRDCRAFRSRLMSVLLSCCVISALIILFTLVPIGIYAVIEKGNGGVNGLLRQYGTLEEAVKRVLAAALAPNSTEEGMWAEHIVVAHESNAYIDVPATYQSRLNSILAPIMFEHEADIWGAEADSGPSCVAPETRQVAFSLSRSGRLPATLKFENCTPAHECQEQKMIHDIRGFSIAFSEASNQHVFHIRPTETHIGPPENDTSSARYLTPWIDITGPLQVELSDTGKLALLRFCGHSVVDVDRDPMNPDNTRLITVLELKRLYGIWVSGTIPRGDSRDPLSLFKSVITPRNHALHASTTAAIYRMLQTKLGPLTSRPENGHQETLRDRFRWDFGKIKSKISKDEYDASRFAGRRVDIAQRSFLAPETKTDTHKVEAMRPSFERHRSIPDEQIAMASTTRALRQQRNLDATEEDIQNKSLPNDFGGPLQQADEANDESTVRQISFSREPATGPAISEHNQGINVQSSLLQADQPKSYLGYVENVDSTHKLNQISAGKQRAETAHANIDLRHSAEALMAFVNDGSPHTHRQNHATLGTSRMYPGFAENVQSNSRMNDLPVVTGVVESAHANIGVSNSGMALETVVNGEEADHVPKSHLVLRATPERLPNMFERQASSPGAFRTSGGALYRQNELSRVAGTHVISLSEHPHQAGSNRPESANYLLTQRLGSVSMRAARDLGSPLRPHPHLITTENFQHRPSLARHPSVATASGAPNMPMGVTYAPPGQQTPDNQPSLRGVNRPYRSIR